MIPIALEVKHNCRRQKVTRNSGTITLEGESMKRGSFTLVDTCALYGVKSMPFNSHSIKQP